MASVRFQMVVFQPILATFTQNSQYMPILRCALTPSCQNVEILKIYFYDITLMNSIKAFFIRYRIHFHRGFLNQYDVKFSSVHTISDSLSSTVHTNTLLFVLRCCYCMQELFIATMTA